MRLLFVVQRYGHDVAGGAERSCRELATGLVGRGHEVEVVTTRARSYVDWADLEPAGTSELDGVVVHRLSVAHPRDPGLFDRLNRRVLDGRLTPSLLRAWMLAQGPVVDELPAWLAEHGRRFDAVAFVTYLYWTAWAGLPAVPPGVPTVLHPTAHEEPPLYLPLFDAVFARPSGFAFLTEEEQALVERRFLTGDRPSAVVGLGMDLDAAGDPARFRSASGLGDRPYLLYVGRLDPGKGSDELYDGFLAYKRRRPGPLALVMLGEPVKPVPPHPDVVVTGWVDDAAKHDALAGAELLVQPSYYESFSLALTDAWLHRVPALVQGRCDVLAGQVRRAGGGVPYEGYAELEASLDRLLPDAALRRRLGERGRAYVESRYAWPAVLDRYEDLLGRVRSGG